MHVKDIIAKNKNGPLSFMMEELMKPAKAPVIKDVAMDVWREEGEKMIETMVGEMVREALAQVSRAVDEMKALSKGDMGPEPSVARLIALIRPLIPRVENGKTPTEKELRALIRPLIPEPIPGQNPSKDELRAMMLSLDDNEEETPAELAKRINSLEQKIDPSVIMGYTEMMKKIFDAISKSKLGGKAYLHGGGGTTSDGVQVFEEVPAGSGTSFTLAHTPDSGTLRLFRGGARQQAGAGKDFTLSGATITLAVTLNPAEILLADYQYT